MTKTFCWAFFGLALALTANAQTLIFGFRVPGTEVRIVNDTEDRSPLKLFAGDKEIRGFVGKGGQWKAFYADGSGDQAVLIQACQAAGHSDNYTIIAPPAWAIDQEVLGNAAFTVRYLTSNPKQVDLEKRVADIEKALRGRLGRKRMIADLHDWLSVVKQKGLEHRGADSCTDPKVLAIRVRVGYGDYVEKRVAILVIRGSYEKGYRIDGPRDAWY